MAKVGAQRAAELTGVSKSTIQRAMTAGKLSFELDSHQRRLVDVSELERVFGLKPQSDSNTENSQVQASSSMQLELEKARHALELEKVRMELRLAQEQLDNALSQIEDLKIQRDLWQKQAQQILITSQYSQKQSEERITEMQQREAARQAALQRRAGAPSSAQAQPIRPQNPAAKPAPQAEVVNRPIQGNATSVGTQTQSQPNQPIFRTVQPGNQNRSAAEPAQKQSLFASLFGGNKKRTGTAN